MRITFQGNSTPGELMSEINDLLIDLAELGVDELERINLYLDLRVHGEPVQIRTRSGSKVDILTVQKRTTRSYARNDASGSYSAARARKRGSSR